MVKNFNCNWSCN